MEEKTPAPRYHDLIPPPEVIRQYEEVIEGSGAQILKDMHQKQELDRFLTRAEFNRSHAMEVWGTVAGAVITTACIVGVFLSIFLIEDTQRALGSGAIFGLGALGMIVLSVFTRGRNQRNAQRQVAHNQDRG